MPQTNGKNAKGTIYQESATHHRAPGAERHHNEDWRRHRMTEGQAHTFGDGSEIDETTGKRS